MRGFRVEPGEVEAVLAAHPGVAQAAVVAREDGPGEQAAGGLRGARRRAWRRSGGLAAAVREFAAGRLPEYMVPSAVVVLDGAAADGEREAGPAGAAGAGLRGGGGGRRGGRGRCGRRLLCGVFAEVLGVERVGAG